MYSYIATFWRLKINKTEISVKILKRKKNKVFIISITQKNYSAHLQGKVFPLNQTWTNSGSGSSSRERHRILVAILDFAKEAEKHKKITGQIH